MRHAFVSTHRPIILNVHIETGGKWRATSIHAAVAAEVRRALAGPQRGVVAGVREIGEGVLDGGVCKKKNNHGRYNNLTESGAGPAMKNNAVGNKQHERDEIVSTID